MRNTLLCLQIQTKTKQTEKDKSNEGLGYFQDGNSSAFSLPSNIQSVNPNYW